MGAEWVLLPNDNNFNFPVFLAPFTASELVQALRRQRGPNRGWYYPMTHHWMPSLPGVQTGNDIDNDRMWFIDIDRTDIRDFLRDVEQQCLSGVNNWNMNKNAQGSTEIGYLRPSQWTPFEPARQSYNPEGATVFTVGRKYAPAGSTHTLPITAKFLVNHWYRNDRGPARPIFPDNGYDFYDSDYDKRQYEVATYGSNPPWTNFRDGEASYALSYDQRQFYSHAYALVTDYWEEEDVDRRTYELGMTSIATVEEFDISTWGDLPVNETTNWNYYWGIEEEKPWLDTATAGRRRADAMTSVRNWNYDPSSNWTPEGNTVPTWARYNNSVALPRIFIRTSDNKLAVMAINVFSEPRTGNRLAAAGARLVYIHRLSSDWDPTNEECKDLLMPRFNPRAATNNVGIYALSRYNVSDFIEDLFNTDVWEWADHLFNGDGADALLSMKWFFGIKDHVTYRSGSSKITMGGLVPQNSPVVKALSAEIVEMHMGSVNVVPTFGDHRDFTEVEYRAWIPMVGFIELNPFDVVGNTLALTYYINASDGTAIAQLINCADCQDGIIFAQQCTWGIDIPFRVDAQKDAARLIGETAVRTVGGALGGSIAGPAGAIAGGVAGAGSGLMQGTGQGLNYSVGSLGGNANLMSDFRPKIMVYAPDDETDAGFVNVVGLPTGKSFTVSSASGFLAVTEVQNTNVLPARYADEIVALLKAGVYTS